MFGCIRNNVGTVDVEALRSHDWKSFRHIWNANGEALASSYHGTHLHFIFLLSCDLVKCFVHLWQTIEGTGALKQRQKKKDKNFDKTDDENQQTPTIQRFLVSWKTYYKHFSLIFMSQSLYGSETWIFLFWNLTEWSFLTTKILQRNRSLFGANDWINWW
jgi:hypothetical protein